MGIFSKKTKSNPVVETQGLRIEYDPASECWEFSHEGIAFIAYGTTSVVPSQEHFSSILTDMNKLRPEMARRLAEGWKDSEDVKANDGETCLVDITELHSQGDFVASWSGGESWGDMEVDFTITNHEIADESWGD
jgi:hypothetical protein